MVQARCAQLEAAAVLHEADLSEGAKAFAATTMDGAPRKPELLARSGAIGKGPQLEEETFGLLAE